MRLTFKSTEIGSGIYYSPPEKWCISDLDSLFRVKEMIPAVKKRVSLYISGRILFRIFFVKKEFGLHIQDILKLRRSTKAAALRNEIFVFIPPSTPEIHKILCHEVFHAALYRKMHAYPKSVPSWFNEGVAAHVGGYSDPGKGSAKKKLKKYEWEKMRNWFFEGNSCGNVGQINVIARAFCAFIIRETGIDTIRLIIHSTSKDGRFYQHIKKNTGNTAEKWFFNWEKYLEVEKIM